MALAAPHGSLSSLSAIEILDSRSRPTLQVTVTFGGVSACAGVPSGASTGSGEAVELRDGDFARYSGQGVLHAVRNVNGPIADALIGRSFSSLEEVDHALIELDGTADKSRLGANAIVGVSMAVARAMARSAGQSLWRALAPDGVEPRLPVPHFNVINGGAHAANALDFQEFMIAPLGAPTFADAVRAGSGIYGCLKSRLVDRGLTVGLGDEGGFAPELDSVTEVLALLVLAIEDAGYEPGPAGVTIALDPAASEFCRDGHYMVAGQNRDSDAMIEFYEQLCARFPIWSIEDGLGEHDSAGWKKLTTRLGDTTQLVGDDNFVTNPRVIAAAARDGIGNAALIKLNQIGTVTETLDALRVCREAGYGAMLSHRSGETTDTFIADLAVGSGCGQMKSGAPARGERVAKYNRLLSICAQDAGLEYGLPA